MLQIPVLSVSCQEAVTLVIKPCALIPDSVHMCRTRVPGMLCHPSHGTDCPKRGKVLRLPLRSYRQYNRISQLRFDSGTFGGIRYSIAAWQMFNNLGDQESELLCPPSYVELRDLFLKFLHVALVEMEDAIIGSLCVVRFRSLVIFRVLGWPGRIFPYLYGYQ